MRDFGLIRSIRNDEAKIVLDSGEVIYRDVNLIQPDTLVRVGRILKLEGYRMTIDLEEEDRRLNK